MKNYVDALNELDNYYSRESKPLTPPIGSYEVEKQDAVRENTRGYEDILKSYKFNFDNLRKIFYGVKMMETMVHNGKNVMAEIIKKEKYNDAIGFALGLGEMIPRWEYFSKLKNLAIEETHKVSSRAYFIFYKILEIGYKNKRIHSNQEGKEEKNHYKNLFSDETLSKNFLEAFINCKIPLNQSEGQNEFYLNEKGLEAKYVYDPNIDGKDKSLYITEINKTLKRIYGIESYERKKAGGFISVPK